MDFDNRSADRGIFEVRVCGQSFEYTIESIRSAQRRGRLSTEFLPKSPGEPCGCAAYDPKNSFYEQARGSANLARIGRFSKAMRFIRSAWPLVHGASFRSDDAHVVLVAGPIEDRLECIFAVARLMNRIPLSVGRER